MFIELHGQPVWAPADEGEGQSPGEAPQGDAAPPPSDDTPPRSDGGDPAPKSSILDFKTDPKPEGADEWKLPDGLEIPDHLKGSNAEDTLRKMSVAYKGARQEISSRKKADGVLEGAVPKDIDGYNFDSLAIDPKDDPALQDLTSEESKPIVDAFRSAALEAGIPDQAFAKLMHGGMAKLMEGGLNIASGEEATRINGEAEMASLVEEVGQAGADQIIGQLDSYGQKLASRGILSEQADVEEYAQMVGTARAARIMNRIIQSEFGERAIPPSDGVDGSVTVAEAYEQHASALRMPQGSDREEAIAAAEARIAKAMKEQGTPGQVKSRVL